MNRFCTDVELHRTAVRLAMERAHWRAKADAGGGLHFTRAQCLRHARDREAAIVDIAINAEWRFRREAGAAHLTPCHNCANGADAGIERVCTHPALADWAGSPQPVAIVRAWGGGCGPDAQHHAKPAA